MYDDGMVAATAKMLAERLSNEQATVRKWDRYYEGEQPLAYMPDELLRELDGRVKQVVVNWPRLVVDSVEERLDVEGFRFGETNDPRAWEWWQANDLDEESQLAHVDALAAARSFVIVGQDEDDDTLPLITVESAEQVTVLRDPASRRVKAALKCWTDAGDKFRVVYLPDRTVYFYGKNDHRDEYEIYNEDRHDMGVVPVVPLVNRRRLMRDNGVSDLADVAPLSDAACKIATDMMTSAEFHGMPRRIVVGMTEDDFKDAEGRPVSRWQQIAGRLWMSGALPSEVRVDQLKEADLRNFHETLNALARMVASISGLPPNFLGYSEANPTSADAIRASESRLVKRAERKQRAFGGSWEQVIRLAYRVVTGELPENAHRLETQWRDASTPTLAQKADAAVKLLQAGIIPREQARKDLGYTQTERDEMRAEDDAAAARVLSGDFESLLGPKPGQAAQPDQSSADDDESLKKKSEALE